ncbi:MAG: hypothetical protein WCP08_10145 [Prolixibacteraceae bacterium]
MRISSHQSNMKSRVFQSNSIKKLTGIQLIFVMALVGFLSGSGFSQQHKTEITHYIFPEFIKGTVLMKSGTKNTTMLNFNALTEEMIFDSNGKKLAIGHLEQIDTIYVNGRIFFPLENKFAEIIYRNKYELYVLHKCSIVDPGKPAAYGGTSQTSSITTYSSILSGGQAYELQLPEGTETKPFSEYFLKKDSKLLNFVSIRQLSRAWSDKSDQFKKYVKDNKIDYENQESLIGLVKYMEGL